jgi:hypothetical protein
MVLVEEVEGIRDAFEDIRVNNLTQDKYGVNLGNNWQKNWTKNGRF